MTGLKWLTIGGYEKPLKITWLWALARTTGLSAMTYPLVMTFWQWSEMTTPLAMTFWQWPAMTLSYNDLLATGYPALSLSPPRFGGHLLPSILLPLPLPLPFFPFMSAIRPFFSLSVTSAIKTFFSIYMISLHFYKTWEREHSYSRSQAKKLSPFLSFRERGSSPALLPPGKVSSIRCLGHRVKEN